MYCESYSHFFCKKFQHICVSLDVNFNESLTNDIVSFEQLGPKCLTKLAYANGADPDQTTEGSLIRMYTVCNFTTVFTLSIGTSYLLIILVLNLEQFILLPLDVSKILLYIWQTV